MAFIGRAGEQQRLSRLFAQEQQGVALVYGRRRVGKSELIKHCLRATDVPGIYYECKETSERNNVESLGALVSERLGYPRLAFDGIEGLLSFLFEQATRQNMVLVLDEYPYLRKKVEGLDSILQALIDGHGDTSRLKLVLCGSFIDVMKSAVEVHNPLYGRVDVTIDLKPMDYYDAAQFYPGFSDEDKVRLYSVFGGVPYYNRLVDQGRSVADNLIELIVAPGARLENEVPLYLSAEIAKMSNANEVFGALAQGYSRYKDIFDQSHVSSGPAMVDVLDKLIGMELVRKEAPINAPDDRRKSGYRIVDGLASFYYRYLFRYASQRSFMEPEAFFGRYVAADFENRYVPHAFEDVCRQYLVRRNRSGRMSEPFDLIGRYYYDDPVNKRNGEFDVVTHDPRGYVFYEAKFRSTPVDAALIREEISQVEATGLACRRYGFIARSGFTDDARALAAQGAGQAGGDLGLGPGSGGADSGSVELIDLRDLYA